MSSTGVGLLCAAVVALQLTIWRRLRRIERQMATNQEQLTTTLNDIKAKVGRVSSRIDDLVEKLDAANSNADGQLADELALAQSIQSDLDSIDGDEPTPSP